MLICKCNSVYDYYEGDYDEKSDEISTTIVPIEVSDENASERNGKD